jgi:hypothetical protein
LPAALIFAQPTSFPSQAQAAIVAPGATRNVGLPCRWRGLSGHRWCFAEDQSTRYLQHRRGSPNLERLLCGRPDGIFVNPFEFGAIRPDLFRKACQFGLEELVSKRQDWPFGAGRTKHHWLK